MVTIQISIVFRGAALIRGKALIFRCGAYCRAARTWDPVLVRENMVPTNIHINKNKSEKGTFVYLFLQKSILKLFFYVWAIIVSFNFAIYADMHYYLPPASIRQKGINNKFIYRPYKDQPIKFRGLVHSELLHFSCFFENYLLCHSDETWHITQSNINLIQS